MDDIWPGPWVRMEWGVKQGGEKEENMWGGKMAEATLLQETLNACPVRMQSP